MLRTAARMGAGVICPFILVTAAQSACNERLLLTLQSPSSAQAVRTLARRAGLTVTRLRPISAQVWSLGVRGTLDGTAPLDALRAQAGVRAVDCDSRRTASAP